MRNIIAGALGITGFLLVLGAVGSDCYGKCMENALSFTEVLLFALAGFAMIGVAFVTYDKE